MWAKPFELGQITSKHERICGEITLFVKKKLLKNHVNVEPC